MRDSQPWALVQVVGGTARTCQGDRDCADFELRDPELAPDRAAAFSHNLAQVSNPNLRIEVEGEPHIVGMATNTLDHPGGEQLERSLGEPGEFTRYESLLYLLEAIEREAEEGVCDEQSLDSDAFSRLRYASPQSRCSRSFCLRRVVCATPETTGDIADDGREV